MISIIKILKEIKVSNYLSMAQKIFNKYKIDIDESLKYYLNNDPETLDLDLVSGDNATSYVIRDLLDNDILDDNSRNTFEELEEKYSKAYEFFEKLINDRLEELENEDYDKGQYKIDIE